MAIPEANEQKKQLRREMRKLLATSVTKPDHVAGKVRDWLSGHPELKSIALYSPLRGEVDLSSLISTLPEIRWIFPRVEGGDLVLHHVTRLSDLLPGAFGILEPDAGLPAIPPFEIDAFLCPGLAFDEYGGRLGRGRGFYDRMLENARPGALKIGVCRAAQIVPDTFGEAHDIPMNLVISG